MPNPSYPEVAAAIRILKILDALDEGSKRAAVQIVAAVSDKPVAAPPEVHRGE